MRKRFVSKSLTLMSSICVAVAVLWLGFAGCSTSDRDRTTAQYNQDQDVASKIENALNQSTVYKFPDVKVNVYRGRAQLSGFVATEAQRADAARLAAQIPGVASVNNSLLLKQGVSESAGAPQPNP